MRTKHLPIVDPCHENWDAMDRVERGRFCQVCVKQVYDLSGMTEREARGVLHEAAGTRICVRYRHDDEGRIRFRRPARPTSSTCPSPGRIGWAGAAVMAAAMAACTPHDDPDAPRPKADVEVLAPAPDPGHEAKGEIIALDPEPERVVQGEPPPIPEPELLGEIEAVEPPEPPTHEVKGDVAAPRPVVEPNPAEVGILGQAIVPAKVDPAPDEPCDGPKPAKTLDPLK